MLKKSIALILILSFVPLLFVSGAHALTVGRDGNKLTVSGTATPLVYVTIKVVSADDDLIFIRQTKASEASLFSFSWEPICSETKTLHISVKCADEPEARETTFLYEIINPPTPSVTPPVKLPTGGGGGGGGGSFGSGNYSVSVPVETVPEQTTTPQKTTLTDIRSHWGKEAIEELYLAGIVTGNPDGTFLPDNLIKRSEFLSLAIRAIGLEQTTYQNIFCDVSRQDWYAGLLQAALDAGIVSRDSYFRPQAHITREEMAKIAVSVLTTDSTETLPEFTDAHTISAWAVPYVGKAASLGLIEGNDTGAFQPLAGATRAEAATVIKRLYHRLEETK